ncbi:hypothetical protein HK405_011928 [Cladochytrium tenue]|nr:hypothetical protein HK405_011928 [Cladochytrium tenue]
MGDRRLTVVRELREEIGLNCGLSLDELGACPIVSNSYTYNHEKGYEVHKENHFYVVWVSDVVRNAPLTLQEDKKLPEILAARWFEYDEAVITINHDEDRDLLESEVAKECRG